MLMMDGPWVISSPLSHFFSSNDPVLLSWPTVAVADVCGSITPSTGKKQNSFTKRRKSPLSCCSLKTVFESDIWFVFLIHMKTEFSAWTLRFSKPPGFRCLVIVELLTFHWPHPEHCGMLLCCGDASWPLAHCWFVRFLLLYFLIGFPGWGGKAVALGLSRRPSVRPPEVPAQEDRQTDRKTNRQNPKRNNVFASRVKEK